MLKSPPSLVETFLHQVLVYCIIPPRINLDVTMLPFFSVFAICFFGHLLLNVCFVVHLIPSRFAVFTGFCMFFNLLLHVLILLASSLTHSHVFAFVNVFCLIKLPLQCECNFLMQCQFILN